jgi:CheY-like chemotaxis protein
MKVDAAKEGDVYELDPFVFMEEDYVDVQERRISYISLEDEIMNTASAKQTLLLGFDQSDADAICNELQSSLHAIVVKVLQNVADILQYAKEMQPTLIVLDEHLIGGTGIEVCKDIRTTMGDWGENASILIIGDPAVSGCSVMADTADVEGKQNSFMDWLNVDDFIHGPVSQAYLITRIQVSLLRMPLRWQRAPLPAGEVHRLFTLLFSARGYWTVLRKKGLTE